MEVYFNNRIYMLKVLYLCYYSALFFVLSMCLLLLQMQLYKYIVANKII